MKLNPKNEVVADIIRFIGVNVEIIRKDLERQDRERRQSEEQKRLQQQGSKIADLINKHFKEWSSKLKTTMAKTGTGRDLLSSKKEDPITDPISIFGSDLPAIITGVDHAGNSSDLNPTEPNPSPGPAVPKVQVDDSSPDRLAKKATGTPKISRAGGFNVSFEKIGANEKRAKYDRETRTIFINLEHPRITMELKVAQSQIPVDDPNFQRMAYEIAFTEYAIVLAQELSTVQYFFDPQDALVELRQTLDELSKAFATIWRPSIL